LFVAAHKDDFNLQPASPAINKGTDAHGVASTDLSGTPRAKGAIDIGAFGIARIPRP
jgi:hypothetical protein